MIGLLFAALMACDSDTRSEHAPWSGAERGCYARREGFEFPRLKASMF
jgi:hypothetical protein